jgi:hypothetical protein
MAISLQDFEKMMKRASKNVAILGEKRSRDIPTPKKDETPKNKPAGGKKPHSKPNKYRAKRVIDENGVKFDSETEFRRYRHLEYLSQIGEISNLRRQVVYNLNVCKYIADHVYVDKSGREIVEDVKSKYTKNLAVYRIKKKLMKERFNIDVCEYTEK